MAKYRMFRAVDKRDGKSQIWVIRNEVEVAAFIDNGRFTPADIKRYVVRGAVFYAHIDLAAQHIGQDQTPIDEWEFPE